MATTSAPTRPARPARSGFLLDLYRSALGKKYLMAVSGLVGPDVLAGGTGRSMLTAHGPALSC